MGGWGDHLCQCPEFNQWLRLSMHRDCGVPAAINTAAGSGRLQVIPALQTFQASKREGRGQGSSVVTSVPANEGEEQMDEVGERGRHCRAGALQFPEERFSEFLRRPACLFRKFESRHARH